MTSLGRLIFFDQPGTGASDPVTAGAMPTLEQWADSITAVLDDLGSQRSGPRRDRRGFPARGAVRGDASVAHHRAGRARRFADAGGTLLVQDETQARDGPLCGAAGDTHLMNPDMPWNEEIRATWARMERLASSPRTLALIMPLTAEMDVRAVLPTIRVPTLVVHHADNPLIPPAKGKYIAEHIPGAKYVELPGRNWYHPVEPGWRASFQEIAEFLTGHQAEVADDRVLATVLFTDIVESTRRAAEIGDRDWHALLDAHDAIVRAQLSRFRGREVNTRATASLRCSTARSGRSAAPWRSATRCRRWASRCAPGCTPASAKSAATTSAESPSHRCARQRTGGPNDVLVSSTLRDLVIGSGLEFEERGAHELKGVPGEWHLFAVAST